MPNPANQSPVAVVYVSLGQYMTQPSRFIFLITLLKSLDPFALPDCEQILCRSASLTLGAPLGYSMLKTGFLALMKGAKVSHSLYWMHCSLTEKAT